GCTRTAGEAANGRHQPAGGGFSGWRLYQPADAGRSPTAGFFFYPCQDPVSLHNSPYPRRRNRGSRVRTLQRCNSMRTSFFVLFLSALVTVGCNKASDSKPQPQQGGTTGGGGDKSGTPVEFA